MRPIALDRIGGSLSLLSDHRVGCLEDGQWEDRQFLESMRDEVVRFMLGEGATETLNLRLERQR